MYSQVGQTVLEMLIMRAFVWIEKPSYILMATGLISPGPLILVLGLVKKVWYYS